MTDQNVKDGGAGGTVVGPSDDHARAVDYWRNLEHCGCYSPEIKAIIEDPGAVVVAFVESINDGIGGTTIVLLNGRYHLIEESQDYTGHGCQCGSSVDGDFDSLDAAIEAAGFERSDHLRTDGWILNVAREVEP